MEISPSCCSEVLWDAQSCYCCWFTFPSNSRRILLVLPWARVHIWTDCIFRDMLDRTCYIHLFFLCVLFLSDWDGSSVSSGRTRRCFVCCWQLNIQSRKNSRDFSGRKAGGEVGRVTARTCELLDGAERLKRAESRYQVTERTEKLRES